MASIILKDLRKVYDTNKKDQVEAVRSICLKIEDKDFAVFVGPSGCGKTTTLRMIAGLETITEGEVLIDDRLVNDIEPKDRDIAMVFQNYALYPHMNVHENMVFGLKNRKVKKEVIQQKSMEAAKTLGLESELNRRPKELSGGQRQRVAMGRAIVRNPKVFLMDEPLSNLDAKLRVQMRNELIRLHRELKATFVFVTHDQVEAMTLATKIIVMDSGRIMQVDSPQNIYNHPKNMFVAGFIGSPPMNFIEGTLKDGRFTSECVTADMRAYGITGSHKSAVLGIRPEHVEICESDDAENKVFTVSIAENMGSYLNIFGTLGRVDFTVQTNHELRLSGGEKLVVRFTPGKLHLFDNDNGQTLRTRF